MTLTRDLQQLVATEPPLGFDLEDSITRAGQRRKRRRASILAGIGVVAVVAAAAPLAASHLGNTAQTGTRGKLPVSTRASGPAGDIRWPAPGVRPAQPTETELQERVSPLYAQLESDLSRIAPGTSTFDRYFTEARTEFGGVRPTSTRGVSEVEHVGSGAGSYSINLNVLVPNLPVTPFTLARACALDKQHVDATIVCDYQSTSDGGLVLTEADNTANSHRKHEVWVTEYRPDGSFVELYVGTPAGAAQPLTVAQLTTLATDPAFTLSAKS